MRPHTLFLTSLVILGSAPGAYGRERAASIHDAETYQKVLAEYRQLKRQLADSQMARPDLAGRMLLLERRLNRSADRYRDAATASAKKATPVAMFNRALLPLPPDWHKDPRYIEAHRAMKAAEAAHHRNRRRRYQARRSQLISTISLKRAKSAEFMSDVRRDLKQADVDVEMIKALCGRLNPRKLALAKKRLVWANLGVKRAKWAIEFYKTDRQQRDFDEYEDQKAFDQTRENLLQAQQRLQKVVLEIRLERTHREFRLAADPPARREPSVSPDAGSMDLEHVDSQLDLLRLRAEYRILRVLLKGSEAPRPQMARDMVELQTRIVRTKARLLREAQVADVQLHR